MTAAALLVLGLATLVAVVDWVAVARDLRRLEYVAKPAVVVLLVGVALLLDPVDPTQRAWFLAALAASLAGDVLLMLPAATRGRADLPPAFAAGLVAFLLAHVAYLAGFLVVGVRPAGLAVGAVLVVAAGATAGRRILRAGARSGGPAVAAALGAYLVVIGAMVVVAFGSGRVLAAAGATLFFLSDALIGWNRFVRAVPAGRPAIMVTYHLGQAGLVLSLALPAAA